MPLPPNKEGRFSSAGGKVHVKIFSVVVVVTGVDDVEIVDVEIVDVAAVNVVEVAVVDARVEIGGCFASRVQMSCSR